MFNAWSCYSHQKGSLFLHKKSVSSFTTFYVRSLVTLPLFDGSCQISQRSFHKALSAQPFSPAEAAVNLTHPESADQGAQEGTTGTGLQQNAHDVVRGGNAPQMSRL